RRSYPVFNLSLCLIRAHPLHPRPPRSIWGPPMTAIPDVLVLGGGVIGLTTAYHLAKEGASVAVLDSGDLGRQASWAGAGILPPGDPARAHSPLERFRAASVALYPDL